MSDAAIAATVAGAVHYIKEGVGHVRERTLEVGSRVIWIDNIGSLSIVRGTADPTPFIVGGIMVLAGLFILQSEAGMALLLLAAGIGLIVWAAQKKVLNGLTIGTTDGRITMIVSTDEDFLQGALSLLRDKIETGSITLQGTFDVGSTHIDSAGGGVVVGGGGVAGGAGSEIARTAPRSPLAPAAAPMTPAAPPPAQAEYRPPAPPPRPLDPPPSFAPVDFEPPVRRGPPIAALVAAALVVVGAAGGGVWWWLDQQARAAQATWDSVPRDSAESLRAYLADEPGDFRDDAEAALVELETNRYAAARQADTIEAFEAFLGDFPESGNAIAARGRIAELQTIAAFSASTPFLTSPSDGIIYNHFPRNTLLEWQPLERAVSYTVEIQMMDPQSKLWVEDPASVHVATISTPQYAFNFVGAQPGRWRVRAVNGDGVQSQFSDWRTFEYRR